MPNSTSYSFTDLSGAIAHTLLGAYNFTGEGSGEVNIAYATERTAHDVAADGTVMVSKMAGNNGTITINAQQTSAIHKWLVNAFNILWAAPTNQWASMAITLRNVADNTSHIATGVSFGKMPDKPYQAQGQRVTWVLMAADIVSLNVS